MHASELTEAATTNAFAPLSPNTLDLAAPRGGFGLNELLDARLGATGNPLDLWPKSAITEFDAKHHKNLLVRVDEFENMPLLEFCRLVRTDHGIRKDHSRIQPEKVAI
ncbi:hypothetical protein [Xanthomonas campestris]|uniref:hypothetical protein n=1 Tax=Xanthomonas campestris TaxID=339 RepID=UPI002367B090|nr:hypothetical protein [Xanthomonas campestris]WDI92181.1 hypothetical protein JH280_12700 [Xanthomonas campestris]